MEPLATPTSLDLAPAHVIAVVVVACVIGVIGSAVRHFLLASGYELGDLLRGAAHRTSARLLRRRTMPRTSWLCARCLSHNGRAATLCYRCGAARTGGELEPTARTEPPAGAGR